MQRAYQAPAPRRPTAATTKAAHQTKAITWLLLGSGMVVLLVGGMILALGMGLAVVYASQRILPGVSAVGVPLGGLAAEDAAAQLESAWTQIIVRDGSRTWSIAPSQIGLTLDAYATALAAQRRGRDEGSILTALVGDEVVPPVLAVDSAAAELGIKGLAEMVSLPAANATIRMVDGQLTPVDASEGRSLDVAATISRLLSNASEEMADGALDLVVSPVQPTVTDASALMEQVRNLLNSPLIVNAFDPITNQTVSWQAAPDQWSQWLTTENNPTSPTGITLALDRAGLTSYLAGQSLGETRYVDIDKSVAAIQAAIGAGQTTTTIRVYHKPTQYVVQPGDTLGSLSWKFGFPMFRLVNANPGINMQSLSIGQSITVPSKDDLLPLPVVFNKRVVVSISKQHVWVYENGQVKWSWAASTGIADSPTLPGVFQVQSRERNGYAGNWNLWMPYFMGIYDAVPGFTNGFHGFPTRNGYGILWESALGRPVTYGCILISTQNAAALYEWAEDGVVVEIQR